MHPKITLGQVADAANTIVYEDLEDVSEFLERADSMMRGLSAPRRGII